LQGGSVPYGRIFASEHGWCFAKAAEREPAGADWPAKIADIIKGRAEAIVRSLANAAFD